MQKLLVITSRIPYPLEKGDKLRIYHQLKYLSQHFQICLCALNDGVIHPEAENKLKKFCSEIHFFSFNILQIVGGVLQSFLNGEPLQVGYFYHLSIQHKLDKVVESFQPDFIFCQLIRTAKYAVKYPQPKTLDYMDALSKGTERRIEHASFWMKWILKLETKRLKNFEKTIFNSFNAHCIISAEDKKYISHNEAEKIAVIPNGIDLDFFKPIKTPKIYDVVFTGNMSYPPNVKAAKYLAHKIQPLLNKKIKILISGAQPTKKVYHLQSSTCKVTGWVDDIRNSYAAAHLFVAPLKIGTGLQNKILEAMAMKIPCITTSLVNASLGAKENEEILIAENAKQFADKILYLLQNPEVANKMAEKAYIFVSNNYNWQKSTNELVKLILNQKV